MTFVVAGAAKRWERCFSTDTPLVADERLFRSLNMANAAALRAGETTCDMLRSVAWASAFEILRPAARGHKQYIKTSATSRGI
jgi:hypothetical protein